MSYDAYDVMLPDENTPAMRRGLECRDSLMSLFSFWSLVC